jgi:two-component system, OmpR family, copper resistance phosphate regulon response regulator CusR
MKVIIIEDELKVAAFIQRGLMEYGFDSDIAYDGLSALDKLKGDMFDFVLLDVNLPLMGGFQVCHEIRKFNTSIPILMLTALGSTDDKVSGFDAGADDYLVKPFEFVELIARIKALLKRSQTPSKTETILQVGDLELDISRKSVRRAGGNIELTAKEFMLLEFMMRNQGRVLSKAEIASKVWDIHFDTGTNVIEVYVNFLRKKIDRDYDQKLIQTKVGMGYVLKHD